MLDDPSNIAELVDAVKRLPLLPEHQYESRKKLKAAVAHRLQFPYDGSITEMTETYWASIETQEPPSKTRVISLLSGEIADVLMKEHEDIREMFKQARESIRMILRRARWHVDVIGTEQDRNRTFYAEKVDGKLKLKIDGLDLEFEAGDGTDSVSIKLSESSKRSSKK